MTYHRMQEVMQDATSFQWQASSHARDPTDYLTSRAYWALICAQYFPKTLYILGANPDNLNQYRSELNTTL